MTERVTELSQVPNGWQWTKLEECVDILDNQRVPVNTKERKVRISGKSSAELYPYYGATSQVGWIDCYLFDEELVLLGEDGAPFLEPLRDKAYIVRGKSWVNNHAHVLRALGGLLLNSFLCHYLNIFDYHGYVTGTTRFKLNQSPMRRIPVPLPPLAEQRRIVGRVEELFSWLDAGVESLLKTKKLLKRYRQAILKHAFEGKLTEEWRKTHKHETESATELLQQIKQEKKRRLGDEYEDLHCIDRADLPQLPEGWVWARIAEIGLIISGQTPKGIDDVDGNGEVPFYKVGDMNKVGNEKYMTYAEIYLTVDDIKRLKLHVQDKGTVIFPKRGGAIATNKKRILSSQSAYDLNVMGVFPLIIPHEFLYYWISKIDLMKLSDGSNVPQINHKDIAPLPFPLAPLDEQYVIVNEVGKRLSVVEELEETVKKSLKRAERLRQSILKTAFGGKLVPQDPSDEPAEKLLERIKEERAKSKGEKDTNNKKRIKPKQLELSTYVE